MRRECTITSVFSIVKHSLSMAKYRSLTHGELEALRDEFVQYLVANGIPADEWAKIKKDDQDAAQQIIDLFSDVIMEGVLRKTSYVEHYAKQRVLCFYFADQEVTMIGMESEALDADFTDPEYIAHATAHPPSDLKISSMTKPYVKTRSEEIWDLIDQGCTVSQGGLYKALQQVSKV